MNLLSRFVTFGALAAALIYPTTRATAATFGWSGSGAGPGSGAGNVWLTPGNWTNNLGTPTNTDIAFFGAGGSATAIGFALNGAPDGSTNWGAIVLGAGSTVDRTIGQSSTAGGSNIFLYGVGGGFITNEVSGRTLTIAPFIAGGTTVPLTLRLMNNGVIHTVGNVNIISHISEAGGARNITKTGAGTLTLSTNNSFSGKTIINQGTVAIVDEFRLGTNASGTVIPDQLTINGGILQALGAVTFDDTSRGITIGSAHGTFNNNGQTITISRPITGPGNITNTGTGTVIFNTANSYTGRTVLRGGVTRVINGAGFGALPGAYVADQIIMDGGGILNQDSEFVLEANRGITLGAGGGRLQAGFARPWGVNSIITGPGTLTIANDTTPQVVYLNAANTFTNDLIVNNTTAGNAALVAINGSIGAGSIVRVTTNGWLLGNGTINRNVMATNGAIVGAGGLFAPGTLTINGNLSLTNAVLGLDYVAANTVGGGINDLLQVNGNLNLSGLVIVRPNPLSGLLAGTYRLINYTGTLIGSDANLIADADGYTVTFDTSTPGEVNMTVSGTPTTLVWNGAAGPLNAPLWDVNFTTNWLNAGNPDVFLQGRNVLFDDTGFYGLPGVPVSITFFGQNNAWGSLVPGSVTVDTTNNVTLAGPAGALGKLSGGMSLTKRGPGILAMTSGNANFPNDYSGTTTVEEGLLRPGYTRAFGATNSPTIATNIGTIDVNGQSLGAEPFVASGAGLNGNGAIVNLGGAQNNALRYLTLAGDTTVGGLNRWDVRNYGNNNNWPTAFMLGNGYSLIKTGANQVSFVDVGDTDLGSIMVEQGTLSFEGNARMGRSTSSTVVKNGATLFHWASSVTHQKPISFDNGARLFKDNGNLTYAGPVTLLGGTSIVDVANNSGNLITFNGQVTGPGGLQKNGAGVLQLAGTNDYTGNTVVAAGSVEIRPTGSISNSAVIDVRSGAVLNVTSRPAGISLAAGQTLTGAGTVAGIVTADAGSSIAPGTSPGTLSINSNLNLNGASLTFELNTATTEGGGVNDLINARDLSLAGLSTINIVPLSPLSAGPYRLFRYTNSLTGGAGNLNVVSGSRYSFTVDTSVANLVQITSSGTAGSLVWAGGESGSETVWDVNTTMNWLNGVTPDNFFQADAVTFDDSSIYTNIALFDLIAPGPITVNSSQDYEFGGAGQIESLNHLLKNGTGRLTIAGDHPEMNGGVTISGGSLQIGKGGSSGAIGTGAITNNGILIHSRSGSNALPNVIRGSGSLVKEGTGVLAVSGGNAFSGPVNVNQGVLRVANAGALGSSNNNINVAGGAQVDVAGVAQAGANQRYSYTIAGYGPDGRGAIINSGNGVTTSSGMSNVTLSADAGIGNFGPDGEGGRMDIGSAYGLLDGGGNKLVKLGHGRLSVRVTNTVNLSEIVVSNGFIYAENADFTLGTNVTVYPGGVIGQYSATGVRRMNNPTIFLEGGTISGGGQTVDQGTNTWLGPVFVNQPSFLNAGVLNGSVHHLLAGELSGSGRLTVIGNNNRRFDLYGANTAFSGGWAIGGGAIVRVSTNSSLGSGAITNFGTIEWFGADTLSFAQPVAGQGTFRHTLGAGPWTVSGYFQQGAITLQNGTPANAVTFDSTAVVDAGSIAVGITNFGPAVGSAALNIQPGARVRVGNFFMGDQNTQTGTVAQVGGDVVITNQFRLGHWPNSVNTYTLDDGSLTMAMDPATTPVTTGATEVSGGFYIGIDSVGVFTQNGGTLTTPNIVLDNRASTVVGGVATNTFNLNGGTLVIGRWGIQSPNSTYDINLNGGTVAASTSWTSALRMTISGTPVVVDPGPHTITLNGPLSGGGGITKNGNGTLLLNGTNTFPSDLTVNAGTIGGNGSVTSFTYVDAGGTLSPGTSVGVFTINSDIETFGTMLMEVNRTSPTAYTNDTLRVSSQITLGGTLIVTNIGQALVGGEVFKLIDCSLIAGAFDTIVLPPLAAHLSWNTDTLYVDGIIRVAGAPSITLAPVSQTVYEGDNVRFSAAAAHTDPFSVRWQFEGTDIPGATGNTLALTNVQLANAGTYSFVASNASGELSASATLTVLEVTNLADGLVAHWPLDSVDGAFTPDITTNANHLFLTNMTSTNVVAGQRSNAFSFFTNVNSGLNSLLTRSYAPGNVLPAYQYPGYTVAMWVRGSSNQVDRRVFSESHSNANNQLVNIGTFNSASTNGAVDIFIRSDAGGTALVDHRKTTLQAFNSDWHHIAFVDNNGAAQVYVDGVLDTNNFNYTRATLTLNTIALGGIQRATASAWFHGQIDDVMIWRRALDSNEVACVKANALGGAPVITENPTNQSVACSGTATFVVAATSVDVIRYQWYLNGSPIAGATNATLNYVAGSPGSFFAVLSNCVGSVTSEVATLTVTDNTPALISPAGALAVGAETNSCGDLSLAGGAAYRWELSNAAGSAGSGWDILHVAGDIDVDATSGNPFTVNLVSLNGGALGLAANWNNDTTNVFTIATASGAVNGFAANKFVLNDSLFANDLAGGAFSIEEGSLAIRFTPNHSPVANSVTNNRAPNTSFKLSIADLLANATSDADGDGRALVSVSASTNGATITTNSTFIFYNNFNNVEDEFTYTVRDVHSYRPGDSVRTATGTIRITVNTPAGTNQNFVTFGVVEGKPTMRFAGIPGYTYDVQRTTDLTPPVVWQTLHTTNAPPLGLFDFVDENPPVGSAYYRTALP